jgi:transmembrane sensor
MRLRAVPRTQGMIASEAAAYWIVRQDRGDLSASEEREFRDWFEDPQNAAAYARAARAADVFADDDGSDPHLRALRQAALEAAPAPRRRWMFAVAASIAILISGAALFLSFGWRPDVGPANVIADARPAAPVQQAQAAAPNEYVTGVGERRVIHLSDGSTVTLNTRSRLVLAFSPDRRLVRLVQGQALFEVAHDRNRPFTVEAADRQVTALGTVFEVRVDPGRVHVLLIEGRVVVDRAADASGSSPTIRIAPAILRPGQEYVAELGAAQQIAQVDVNRQLMWRDGFVEFDDEPLANAVAEMNRYTDRPIQLSNDGVATLRISGIFRTGNSDRFVNTVGEILPIDAHPTPQGRIELSMSGARAH